MKQPSIVHLNQNVSHLVVSWVLMIPLLYFASVGNFWFQSVKSNNPLSEKYGSLVGVSQSKETTITALVIGAIVLAFIAPHLIFMRKTFFKKNIFLFLSVLAVVSSAWSQFPDISLKWSIFLFIETMFSFYLYYYFGPQKLLKILLMFGWICLISSIITSLLFPQYGIDYSGSSIDGWKGIYGQKNTCSMMTVFLLSIELYVSRLTMLARVQRVIYISLSVFLILMSQSATGKILLFFLVIYKIFMDAVFKFKTRSKIVVIMILMAVTLSLLALGALHLNQIWYVLGKDSTLSGRTEIWKAAMASVLKSPMLGYGYMAFWRGFQGEAANVSLANAWFSAYAHSGYLNLLTTLGLSGMIAFLWSLVLAIRNARICICNSGLSYTPWYLCVIILTVILNIDEVTIMTPNNLLWMLYVVASIGLAENAKQVRFGRLRK